VVCVPDDDDDDDGDNVFSGEGHVYTVGRIGKRRVVSTKLSRIGHETTATDTATTSTVTRLLGLYCIRYPFHLQISGSTVF